MSSNTFTASGFYYLAGRTVRATAGGLDLGNVVIQADGSFSVTLGTDPAKLFTSSFVSSFSGSMKVLAGFLYNGDGQLVRRMDNPSTGARLGTDAAFKKRRTSTFGMLVVDTQGLYIGTDFVNTNVVTFTTGPDYGAPLAANVLKSGVHVTTLTDDYGFDSMLAFRAPGPFPATIAALGDFLATQDK